MDLLFRVLKYGYGAYQFFGGDDVFLAAKQGILAELDGFPGKDVNPGQLAELLQRQLSLIQDGHFSIGGKKMCRRYRFFARFDTEFDECGGRFYPRQAPDRWAAAVEGEDPSRWMKPSIDCDGEVFYCLGAVSDSDSCVPGRFPRAAGDKHSRETVRELLVVRGIRPVPRRYFLGTG